MSLIDKQIISQSQYFEELKNIIISVPPCSIKSYLEQKELYGKDISLFYDEIEFLKQAETSIMQLKDIALFLGNKVVEVRKQHYDEIEYLEAEIMQAKEEIQEQKQKLQEYYQIYQSMEEKNIQYQKQNFELEEQCDKYLQKLSALYSAMEAVEHQRIQSWNMSKKNNPFSMNQFTNEDDLSPKDHPTISLQNFSGQHQQTSENLIGILCSSCTEKQFMIDQLQEEINNTNQEKYNLKEKIFNLKGQLEMLKKRNGELEKTTESINLLEKYSSIQKQRMLLKQGKSMLQTNHFYSTDKALSPCPSINNTAEEEPFLYSSSQNPNYQNLLDELNQIKLRSANLNQSELTLAEFQNSEITKKRHGTQDFTSQSDNIGLFGQQHLQSMRDYYGSSSKQFPGVTSFNNSQTAPCQKRQGSPTNVTNNIVSNFAAIQKKSSQSECSSPTPTEDLENRQLIDMRISDSGLLNKNKSAFCSIELPHEILYLSNQKATKDKNSGESKVRSSKQKKEFYKNSKQFKSELPNEQVTTPKNKSQNTSQLFNDIDGNNEKNNNIQNYTIKVQNSSLTDIIPQNQLFYDIKNQKTQILDSINSNLKSQIPSLNLETNQMNYLNVQAQSDYQTNNELIIQLPLTDDLKNIMNLKDSFENFNNIFSQSSIKNKDRTLQNIRSIYHLQNDFKSNNTCENIDSEEGEDDAEEEEKKEYIQSNQNIFEIKPSQSQELRSVSDFQAASSSSSSSSQSEQSQNQLYQSQNQLSYENQLGNSQNQLRSLQSLNSFQDTGEIQQQQSNNNQKEKEKEKEKEEEEIEREISNVKEEVENEQVKQEEKQEQEQEEQIQDDSNYDKKQLNKCIVQSYPIVNRSLFVKIFQWIIFLMLIPLSIFVSKPSFLNSKKNS